MKAGDRFLMMGLSIGVSLMDNSIGYAPNDGTRITCFNCGAYTYYFAENHKWVCQNHCNYELILEKRKMATKNTPEENVMLAKAGWAPKCDNCSERLGYDFITNDWCCPLHYNNTEKKTEKKDSDVNDVTQVQERRINIDKQCLMCKAPLITEFDGRKCCPNCEPAQLSPQAIIEAKEAELLNKASDDRLVTAKQLDETINLFNLLYKKSEESIKSIRVDAGASHKSLRTLLDIYYKETREMVDKLEADHEATKQILVMLVKNYNVMQAELTRRKNNEVE